MLMLRTIRSKLIFIITAMLFVFSVVFFIYAFNTTQNYKELRHAEIIATVESACEKVNVLIAHVEQNAIDLALAGKIYFTSTAHTLAIGESIVLDHFVEFPLAIGGGIWYEPYIFGHDTERMAIYAFFDGEKKLKLDTTIYAEDYTYHPQQWYQEIKQPIISKKALLAWTTPYVDNIGTECLMITAGAGIYDIEHKLIGISTVDWALSSVIDELSKINLTRGSFALFASPEKDYILADTSCGSDIVGKSLQTIEWYHHITIPRGGGSVLINRFVKENQEYIAFTKRLKNNLCLTIAIPVNEIFQVIEQRNQFFILIFITTAIVALSIALYIMITRITQPIAQLISEVQEIGDGNLETLISIVGHDEIGLLGRTFNQMTAQLKEQIVHSVKTDTEKEQLEKNTRLRGEFFERISQEIQTPMNDVMDCARALSKESLTFHQNKLVTDIMHSTNLLMSIVNEMLDLSRIDSDNLSLTLTQYDFHSVLSNINLTAEKRANKKNLQFKYRQKPSLPRYLYGDQLRLQQVLTNIINNAIKFTEEGFVEFSVDADANYFHFTIRDSGIGIKAEELPNLLSAKPTNPQSTQSAEHSGFGLMVCKSLVNLMNGSIQVSSVYGKGSMFAVHIPIVLGDEEKNNQPKINS